MGIKSRSIRNILVVLALLSSIVPGTSFASSVTKPLVGKSCLSREVGKSVVYKASMGRSIYSSQVRSYLECTKYRGKFLWMSTITPKSFSFTKPSKNKVIITPAAAGNPVATQTSVATPAPVDTQAPASPQDVYTPPALPVSDWTGFVAPKVSFVKMLSCVKSAKMEYGITGVLAYKFTIINQIKLTGGHYNYDGHIYSSSDVLYITHGPYTESTNSMDLSMGLGNPMELQFLAFNWKDHGGGPTAGGVSDAGYQNLWVSYIFHSTQAECDNLPKP